MLYIHTGRNRLLAPALTQALRAPGAETRLIVVPRQLTLQTERMLLQALELRGSFALQVLSAERLCGRIFDAAGQPEGERIDDRGRIMLVRAAARAAGEHLTVYRGAEHRRGFPERAARQLERIRQARVNAEALRACADEMTGSARMKLNDLSYILEAYEQLLEGRYQDGETEFGEAVARVRDADFLKNCDVWFFGFDMVPPTLHELIAAVASVCDNTNIFLPLENDANARDFDAFLPMQQGFERLVAAARCMGAGVERIELEESAPAEPPSPSGVLNIGALLGRQPPERRRVLVRASARRADLAVLERELFAYPARPAAEPARSVQLTLLRNPLEECMFAAALIRRLVRQRGWRWDDVLILCRDVETYSAPLRTAFDAYGVPLFLSASRSAARHAAAECLLTALRVIDRGCPAEDMFALMGAGLMPVTDDEADRLCNYAVKYGLRGNRFLTPLRRGSEEEIAALEPVRARLAEPLLKLRDRLRRAATLPEQLAALFGFLTDIDAYPKSLERMNRLAENGMREAAGEEGQVWNRILGALDQMYALMGEEKLSMRELTETLTESLSASVIKALPQSGDAVYAQSTDAACARAAKAVLILGASDRPVSDDDGLLTPGQKQALSSFTKAYLGPDDADLSRLRRFYMKSALGMASEYVSISCPLSGSDGAAQRPSALFEMVEALFPGTQIRGGLTDDASVERMLRSAPRAAVTFVARALAGEEEGVPPSSSDRAALAALSGMSATQPEVRADLLRLRAAMNRAEAADSLSSDVALSLYDSLHRLSITQLELFAACPFSYYVRYGLKPERVEPFELNARDEGTFFHGAVNEFLLRSRADLNDLDADTAATRMDAIADALLDAMSASGPLGDSAVSMAERRRLKSTARVCAVVLADHMRGSRFHAAALEQSFGREDGPLALTLPGGCVLEGRIDRIDEWDRYLRVIDYKRGGKTLKLSEAYYGLRLQLPIYLAAARKKRGGESAGVYYFPLSEGILSTQATDPLSIDAERRRAFRMEGLLPDSKELLEAMSPRFTEVLKARTTAGGELYKGTTAASPADFDNLTRCAMDRAGKHLAAIRSGHCEAAPARLDQSNPCTWCDNRALCLFDDRLDGARVRKFRGLSGEEVLTRLRAESETKE